MLTRCFIAVEISPAVQNSLVTSIDSFKSKQILQGKWTKPEQMHVTLRFMGELDDTNLNLLRLKLREISFSPFAITVGPFGYFSGARDPIRVLWTQIKGAEIVQGLVDEALLPEFPPDDRHQKAMKTKKYSHHITLCRVKKISSPLADCKRMIKESQFNQTQNITSIVLIKSELTKQGPIYTEIERFAAI